MSELERTEQGKTPSQSPSEDEVTIVVRDEVDEEESSTQVVKESDPIWRELRGLRKQIALTNRRLGKKDKHSQVIGVQSSVTEVTENAAVTISEQSVTAPQATIERVSERKRTSPFDSMFRKWR